jgi:hypothetical protein
MNATILSENVQIVSSQEQDLAQQLREASLACRVSFTWFGVRKTLTPQEKAEAAAPFGAEAQFLSASKHLFNTRHPAYRAVTAIRSQVRRFWYEVSLPFPQAGIRLIRRQDVTSIDRRLQHYREILHESVDRLENLYHQLQDEARRRLGRLYRETDYPPSLRGLFDLQWDYPNVEPPEYLARLASQVYEAECRRVQARFEEAVSLVEEAFSQQLRELVAHLVERLTPGPDGQPKIFRDSAVESFQEFFRRFRTLVIRTPGELEELVREAEGLLRGVRPEQLRRSGQLREEIRQGLEEVQERLDLWLVDRPRRRILCPQPSCDPSAKTL